MSGADGQYWAQLFIERMRQAETDAVLRAVNSLTGSGQVNRASVVFAACEILGQSIAQAPLDVAAEVRAGIMALLDGAAMRAATHEADAT